MTQSRRASSRSSIFSCYVSIKFCYVLLFAFRDIANCHFRVEILLYLSLTRLLLIPWNCFLLRNLKVIFNSKIIHTSRLIIYSNKYRTSGLTIVSTISTSNYCKLCYKRRNRNVFISHRDSSHLTYRYLQIFRAVKLFACKTVLSFEYNLQISNLCNIIKCI